MKRLLLILAVLALPLCSWAGFGMQIFEGPMLASAEDVTAPELQSATIASSGDTISLAFNEAVTIGSGGNGGVTITMSGGAATLTYASGDGGSTLVYDISRTIASGETGNLDYTQPGDGIEDASGNDLESVSDLTVTNNSTSGSPTFVSTWSLENDGEGGVSGEDGTGTNDLTVVGVDLTTTRKEGSGAAQYVSSGSDYLYRSDANLSSDTPFKSGTSNKDAFICFWYRPVYVSARYYIWSKYRAATGGRSFLIRQESNGRIEVLLGYDGGNSAVYCTHGTALPAANEWYHVQVWYSDTAGSDGKGWCKIKIYRDSTSAYLGDTFEGDTGQNIYLNNQELCIGAQSGSHGDGFVGILDDIRVSGSSSVSESDADKIRAGTL